MIMEICVLLHILRLKSQLTSWINLIKMQISICSILKLYGVLTVILLTQEMLASMPIIGRISEESHIFLIMRKSNALNGRQNISFKHMQKDVNRSIDVSILMVGKSKNIIHTTTKCMLADNKIRVQSHIAHIFIVTRIRDNLSASILSCFPKIEEQPFIRPKFTKGTF